MGCGAGCRFYLPFFVGRRKRAAVDGSRQGDLSHANDLLIQQMIESVLFSIPESKGVTTRTHKNKTSMAYSVSQSDLVPMLAKCLLRHGSLAAVENYPEQVRNQGGDATVCAEFMALHEIRRTSNPEELIRAAYEKAIQAATGALRDADVKSSKEVTPVVRQAKRPVWLIPLVAWLIIAGLSIWLERRGHESYIASKHRCFCRLLCSESSSPSEEKRERTRRDMTTPTSRPVSMIFRNSNPNSVIDVRPRW